MTKVRDLISGDIVLVQDSQDRLAVLESIGLMDALDDYPTLFVQLGEGEYIRVWGHTGVVPYLEDKVDLLWENN